MRHQAGGSASEVERELTIAEPSDSESDTLRPLVERLANTSPGARHDAAFVDNNTHDTSNVVVLQRTKEAPAKLGNWSRLLRFCATGSASFAAQYVVLHALLRLGIGARPADFVAYASSAQLNFGLSYRLTWSDAPRRHGRAFAATWLSFNSVVVVAGLANSFVYGEARKTVADVIGLGLAQVTSLAISFTLNHFVVMRRGGS